MVEVKYLKYKDPSSELAPYGVLAKWLGDGSLYLTNAVFPYFA